MTNPSEATPEWTAAKIVSTIYEGMKAQGEYSVEGTRCKYRGGPYGKLRCAAGMLIPDEAYERSMEAIGAAGLTHLWERLNLLPYLRLIEAQQLLHDRCVAEHIPFDEYLQKQRQIFQIFDDGDESKLPERLNIVADHLRNM